jgi:hypothetical protein
MKKFKIVMFSAVACLTAAVFTSCNDEENTLPLDNSGIAGTYKMTSFNTPTAVDYNEDGTTSSNLTTESDCFVDNYIKLNSNHTYSRTDNYIDLASGTPECTAYSESGVWKRDGDVITLTSSDTNGYLPYDTELTYSGDNLNISMTAVDYPGADDLGNPALLNGDVTYGFTRVVVE